VIQDALERARDLLSTHEVAPLTDDVQREIIGIITAFRRQMS
jgi:hypothetical protein